MRLLLRTLLLLVLAVLHLAIFLIPDRPSFLARQSEPRAALVLLFLQPKEPRHVEAVYPSPVQSRRKARRESASPTTHSPPKAAGVFALPLVDWSAELSDAARDQVNRESAWTPRSLDESVRATHPRRSGSPSTLWDDKHIHPVFPIAGGGLGMWLGDRCVLILAPLPFMSCGIGKTPAPRGDLFDQMRDKAGISDPLTP